MKTKRESGSLLYLYFNLSLLEIFFLLVKINKVLTASTFVSHSAYLIIMYDHSNIKPEELDLTSLPWLPLDKSSMFPKEPAIYFAMKPDGEIYYIGKSINPKQRWCKHHKYEDLSRIDSIRIAYLFVDSDLLTEVEKALIEYFRPTLNILLNPDAAELPFNYVLLSHETFKTLIKDSTTPVKHKVFYYIMLNLDLEGWANISLDDISKALGVRKTHLSRAIKQLKEDALIYSYPHPQDKRKRSYRLVLLAGHRGPKSQWYKYKNLIDLEERRKLKNKKQ